MALLLWQGLLFYRSALGAVEEGWLFYCGKGSFPTAALVYCGALGAAEEGWLFYCAKGYFSTAAQLIYSLSRLHTWSSYLSALFGYLNNTEFKCS